MANGQYSNFDTRPHVTGSYDETAIGTYRYYIFDGAGTFKPKENDMARYLAKLDENNIVIDIIKVGGAECCDNNGNVIEEKAIAYIKSIDPSGHQNYALGCKYGSVRANPIEIGGFYHNG